MSPQRLAKALLLGLAAGALTASGACSLILPAGDLDSQYDAGAGGKHTASTSTSTGRASSTSTVSSTRSATGSSTSSATSSSSGSGTGGGNTSCCGDGGCMTDDANCGTCGHVCPPTSTCAGGRCSMAPLITSGVIVFGCGGGSVYYYDHNNDSMSQIPTDGGPACPCPAEKATDVITVAAGYVVLGSYDGTGRHVSAMPAACCLASDAVNVADSGPWGSPPTVSAGVTTDGTNVYWVDDYHVKRAPIGGGTAETLHAWDADASSPGPSGLALTGNDVLVNAYQATTLYVVPTDGGTAATPPTYYSSSDVQSNGTYAVWFSDAKQQGVYLMPVTTALAFQTPTSPLPGPSIKPTGVAIDADYVYAVGTVADGGEAQVVRWTLADLDAGPTVLENIPASDTPRMLCADGPNLFWLIGSNPNGTVIQGDKNPP